MLTALTKDYPLSPELQGRIDLVLEAHDYDPTQIVGILLEVQDLDERHYVPEPTEYIPKVTKELTGEPTVVDKTFIFDFS